MLVDVVEVGLVTVVVVDVLVEVALVVDVV